MRFLVHNQYRAQELLYGWGEAEGGRRSVVDQRLEESEMFWTEAGAIRALTLRVGLKSHRWDECWNQLHDLHHLRVRLAA